MAYPTNEKSGAENLVALTLAIRERCNSLASNQGALTSLTTTAKASLVAAINELVTSLATVKSDLASKTEIDDTVTTTTNVWSAKKTADAISESATKVKNDLLGGAGTAYDTLKELADLIETNKDAITALQNLAAGHVKFDAAQSLTEAQKKQARDNIGTGSTADIAAAKKAGDDAQTTANAAKTAAAKAQSDVDTLKTNVGDTTIDLATIFKNGVTE